MEKRPDMYSNQITVSVNSTEGLMIFGRRVPVISSNNDVTGTQVAETQIITMPLDMLKQIRTLIDNSLMQMKLTQEGH
jgi:hypothetical protein